MVGFKEKTEFSFTNLYLPEYGLRKMKDILHPEDGTEKPEEHYTAGVNGQVNNKYTLSNKLWTYLKNYAAKHKAKGNGFGFGLVEEDSISRTLSARYYKDGSEILVSRGKRKTPEGSHPGNVHV